MFCCFRKLHNQYEGGGKHLAAECLNTHLVLRCILHRMRKGLAPLPPMQLLCTAGYASRSVEELLSSNFEKNIKSGLDTQVRKHGSRYKHTDTHTLISTAILRGLFQDEAVAFCSWYSGPLQLHTFVLLSICKKNYNSKPRAQQTAVFVALKQMSFFLTRRKNESISAPGRPAVRQIM